MARPFAFAEMIDCSWAECTHDRDQGSMHWFQKPALQLISDRALPLSNTDARTEGAVWFN